VQTNPDRVAERSSPTKLTRIGITQALLLYSIGNTERPPHLLLYLSI
jgi:hypothetical protein